MGNTLKEYWQSYSKQLSHMLTTPYVDLVELDNAEKMRVKVLSELMLIRAQQPELNSLDKACDSLQALGELSHSAMSESAAQEMRKQLIFLSDEIGGIMDRIDRHEAYSGHLSAQKRKVWIQKLLFLPLVILMLIAGLTYIGIRLYLGR